MSYLFKTILTAAVIFFLLTPVVNSGNELLPVIDSGNISLMRSEKDLTRSSNRFGFNMFQKLTADEADDNLCFSPLSASYALAMTYNGAAGNTKQAIASTLQIGQFPIAFVDSAFGVLTPSLAGADPSLTLDIANSIWYRNGLKIKPAFVSVAQSNFMAAVQSMDFSRPDAADIINNWVASNTGGKIKTIIEPPITPDVAMFLINAVYFKASWSKAFDPASTHSQAFTRADGSQVDCQMMSTEDDFRLFENEKYQAVDLPYGNGRLAMTIFLPRQGVKIDDLAGKLNDDMWNETLASMTPLSLRLLLPRFKFDSDLGLNSYLKALGMQIAFSPKADFSNMAEESIWIDSVLQKTFIQVDEQGTEAAAATAVIMKKGLTPSMVVDRPFLFVIHDRQSGAILFLGRVNDPTKTN